ncbi:MAG: thiamine phosphate synthase [Acidiferrobacterales bacterium]|nr:thiamine phosphate synthase [Acidiferrobacterales bacterium]
MPNPSDKAQTATRRHAQPVRIGKFDPTLYLVINPEQCIHNSVEQTVIAAVTGGVSAIQLRSKTMGPEKLAELVTGVVDALGSLNIPVFVNDSVHIAASTGVNAVHLGQEDMAVDAARAMLGEDACIGLTVRSVSEAQSAPVHLLDYISVGGVFRTHSKINPDPPIGLDRLEEIVSLLRSRDPQLPIIAISGITTRNLESVLECAVDGVAVVSAICESHNPHLAAQQFKILIDRYKNRMRTE